MRNRPLLALLLVCVCCTVVFNVWSTNLIQEDANRDRISSIDLPAGSSISKSNPLGGHVIAGLSCEKYGGPSEQAAAEMVYWRNIPIDATFTSPFATLSSTTDPKYLTFEPDEGGWNNMRMSMETATAMALSMGRILVLPPKQRMYLLNKDAQKQMYSFEDFFHFDSIAHEHSALEIITMKEFLKREAMTGHLINKMTGLVSFPPQNVTDWNQAKRLNGLKSPLWKWLRTVADNPMWNFDKCVAAFPNQPGPAGAERMNSYFQQTRDQTPTRLRVKQYTGKPTPVDAPPEKRLRELIANRQGVCVYDETLQNAKVLHLMGDNDSKARLLVHFYLFLFFEDWRHDLWTKRFVRDHLRYHDQIQCAAARVVEALRRKSREHGDPSGAYDSFHVRRGDFQYKHTRIGALGIYSVTAKLLKPNSTIFIASDEKNKAFFDPLRKYYHVYFLDDFKHLLPGVSPNFYGMLDQRIASKGRAFFGSYLSTFSGYINRIRGYHSQKEKLDDYEEGIINSYYYTPRDNMYVMKQYTSADPPLWAREFAVGKYYCIPVVLRIDSFLREDFFVVAHTRLLVVFGGRMARNRPWFGARSDQVMTIE
jgi:hypothetical protein